MNIETGAELMQAHARTPWRSRKTTVSASGCLLINTDWQILHYWLVIIQYLGLTLMAGRRGLKLDLQLQKDTPRFQRLVVDYEDNEVSRTFDIYNAC